MSNLTEHGKDLEHGKIIGPINNLNNQHAKSSNTYLSVSYIQHGDL